MPLKSCLSLILALGLAQTATAQTSLVGCPALSDPAAFPASARWMAPISVDAETGWILRDADFDPEIAFSDEGVALMGELVRTLKRETGTDLALVIAPLRGLFAPSVDNKDALRQAYDAVIDQVVSAGAIAPNLMDAIDVTPGALDGFYMRTDTHWSPEGALLSARALGAALAEAGRMPEIPEEPKFALSGNYETLSLSGGLLGAVEEICGADFESDTAPIPVIVPVQSADLESALFDDADDPMAITLVGTSFSSSANFRWQDAVNLVFQQEVRNRSVTGGAFQSAIVAYAENSLRQDMPELLIWEFHSSYVKPYLGSRLRSIIGSVLGDCGPTGSDPVTVSMTDGEWSAGVPLDGAADLVQLSLPGLDLGTVRFRLITPSGQQIRGLASQRDRVSEERRSDVWRFYTGVGDLTEMAPVGGEISFMVEGTDAPVAGMFTACNAASR